MATPSTPRTLEQRIEELEGALRDSEKKSRWANIAGNVLVPLAIGLSGLLVSNARALLRTS